MNWKNEITEALRIDYPIVQAPMLGVTTPAMVAQIANAGGLGSLPVGGLSPDKTLELIRRTRERTDRPFAVNLFAHGIPEPRQGEVQEMKSFLVRLCAQYGLPFAEKDFEPFRFYSYREQIGILLQEQVPIVSFTFGNLDEESIQALKAKGTVLIGTATSTQEALLLEEKGIDIITAQGIEAGGHRGTFLDEGPLPQVGLVSLLTGITSRTRKPVLAAGGICDGPTAKAAFIMGAKGLQIGTAFIASDESAAIPAYKEALAHAADTDTALTRAFSGRWARGLRNRFMDEVERSGLAIPAYPVQNSLVAKIRLLSQAQNNKELTTLWAGQSAARAKALPAAMIFRDLIKEVEELQ
ncbi:nitronate monooxygenase [Paraflavisolibacter sp. H34]|uniref:NAD(P)H-dependent flavin oxidoreductase n=1 Tax=Huijunlia imazamoxiresistens TaxID=3127457 RepID=UPI003017924B